MSQSETRTEKVTLEWTHVDDLHEGTRAAVERKNYKDEFKQLPEENSSYKQLLDKIRAAGFYKPETATEYAFCGDLFYFGLVEKKVVSYMLYGQARGGYSLFRLSSGGEKQNLLAALPLELAAQIVRAQPCFSCGAGVRRYCVSDFRLLHQSRVNNYAPPLLTTRLHNKQAEIVYFLEMFKHNLKLFDAKKIEAERGSDYFEFDVDWLVFLKDDEEDGGCWISGYVEQSGGSYWQPPDEDLVEIYKQKQGESLASFVLETVKLILEQDFYNACQAEAELTVWAETWHYEDDPF